MLLTTIETNVDCSQSSARDVNQVSHPPNIVHFLWAPLSTSNERLFIKLCEETVLLQ